MRIDPDPEKVLSELAHSARKNIKKASKAGFQINRAPATKENLKKLQAIWYFPEDPNFPQTLGESDFLYLAYLDSELVGGMILLKVGSHLFLNNLTATDLGKKHQLQAFLLWHAINDLKDSGIPYIDIGVSYRPNLYRFFKQWATLNYPIIFHPPAIRPHINFKVFREFQGQHRVEIDDGAIKDFFKNRPFTLTPTVEYAEYIVSQEGLDFQLAAAPGSSGSEVEVIDLTELIASPYGGAIVGRDISKDEIWNKYACYDHFKNQEVMRYLSAKENSLTSIQTARQVRWQSFYKVFEGEDVSISHPKGFISEFRFQSADVDKLFERYLRFDVHCRKEQGDLVFPCHQNISESDVEYIYAILRGHLNLCSEWAPTHVKGELKDVETL